jgi:hypothetical protein
MRPVEYVVFDIIDNLIAATLTNRTPRESAQAVTDERKPLGDDRRSRAPNLLGEGRIAPGVGVHAQKSV